VTQRKPAADRSKRRGSGTRLRQRQVSVRLTAAEGALLDAEAERSGLSAPSVLREAFLEMERADRLRG
jgi:hypothetical protein